VFTGPDSAKDETEPVKKKAKNSSTRPPVCEILNMGGKVTGRSIAYVAVLVRSPTHSVCLTNRSF
jgi:hypothetical protein